MDVLLMHLEYETDDQKEWIAEEEVAIGMCIDINAMLKQWEFERSSISSCQFILSNIFYSLGFILTIMNAWKENKCS